ncbi:MAG: hypothetical protein ACJ77A_12475 [Actinomycetota bacterium]
MENGYSIGVYVTYAVVAVGLTAWLAHTLFRNGAVFLHDVFADRPGLAEAVNRLLVTGFYMFNLGYGLWVLKAGRGLDAFGAVQLFVRRLALLLVVLAVMHLVNVFVFWMIRQSRERRTLPPPIAPTVVPRPPPAPAR